LGEGADGGADGGEAVAARGRKILEEVERGEGIGVGGANFGGGRGVEKIGEKDDEAADEGGIGVGAEMAAGVAELADEPDGGRATADLVERDALIGREARETSGAVDDGGEAFVRVVEGKKFVDQGLLHASEVQVNRETFEMRA
jgi:hypothetical protein